MGVMGIFIIFASSVVTIIWFWINWLEVFGSVFPFFFLQTTGDKCFKRFKLDQYHSTELEKTILIAPRTVSYCEMRKALENVRFNRAKTKDWKLSVRYWSFLTLIMFICTIVTILKLHFFGTSLTKKLQKYLGNQLLSMHLFLRSFRTQFLL